MSLKEKPCSTAKNIRTKGNFEDQPDGYRYVPIFVDKSPECKLSTLERKKFLISTKLKIVQFQFKIRKMLDLPVEKCLFLYTDNYRIWGSATNFGVLYEHFNRKIVYMKYTDENLYSTEISNKLRENVDKAVP